MDFAFAVSFIDRSALQTYLRSLPWVILIIIASNDETRFRSGEQLVNGGNIDYSKLDDVDGDVEQFQQAVHESMQTVICSGKNVCQ